MKTLSKSRLISYRQCERKLWLEIHRRDLLPEDYADQPQFRIGYAVGKIAQRLYDPKGKAQDIDVEEDGYAAAFRKTHEALAARKLLFEAAFSAAGAYAFADVLQPIRHRGAHAWKMLEVKSSSEIHDHQRDDVAIQSYIVRQAGLALAKVVLATVDTKWTYRGGGNYVGLLTETDVTEEALDRSKAVPQWIAGAHAVVAKRKEPPIEPGAQCKKPFVCAYTEHCASGLKSVKHPVEWLPKVQTKALRTYLAAKDVRSLRQVPDLLLNPLQLRVKSHTLQGTVYFDRKGAKAALAEHRLPVYFLDFETIDFPVPIWTGTRPYQKIPFQFSLHRIDRNGVLMHKCFLDLGGPDPSKALAQSLIDTCGKSGPIFVYKRSFESGCLKDLAFRFRSMTPDLRAIEARLVDLLPIVEANYYHPEQQGSWSIKSVLPAMVPKLRYDELDGVQDGRRAQQAYLEAIAPETTDPRKEEIRRQLLAYCELDTYAMVRIWQKLAGRTDLNLERA